jgi:hypothetical protein
MEEAQMIFARHPKGDREELINLHIKNAMKKERVDYQWKWTELNI